MLKAILGYNHEGYNHEGKTVGSVKAIIKYIDDNCKNTSIEQALRDAIQNETQYSKRVVDSSLKDHKDTIEALVAVVKSHKEAMKVATPRKRSMAEYIFPSLNTINSPATGNEGSSNGSISNASSSNLAKDQRINQAVAEFTFYLMTCLIYYLVSHYLYLMLIHLKLDMLTIVKKQIHIHIFTLGCHMKLLLICY